ncbi:hypothetical protein RMCBS344292_16366 [Rhizopus microsporus]|nr:hypothetical protein RMCBS344292_16366 [Rhizopus microsporus]
MNVTEQTKKSAEIYAKANDAFFDDDYDEALSLFSQLVDFEPENAEFILKRSIKDKEQLLTSVAVVLFIKK